MTPPTPSPVAIRRRRARASRGARHSAATDAATANTAEITSVSVLVKNWMTTRTPSPTPSVTGLRRSSTNKS